MAPIRRLLISLVVLFSSTTLPVVKAGEQWQMLEGPARVTSFPLEFQQSPPESPEYMVDNTGNKRGVAPIKGRFLERITCYTQTLTLVSFLLLLAYDTRTLTGAIGTFNGPVWGESGSFDGYMKKLAEKKAAGLLPKFNSTIDTSSVHANSSILKRQKGSSFWLSSLGPLGKACRYSPFLFPSSLVAKGIDGANSLT